MRWLFGFFAALLFVLPAQAAADKRVALVIGNAAYQSSPLKNPVNDARAISARLKSLGFEVVLRENLTQKQIGATLREFRSKLTPGAEALFFYAGHGLQVKGVNYLPAVDADISAEEDVPTQSIDVNKVLEVMDENKTRLNLVFLDACRNNPFSRGFRSAGGGLAKIAAPSGTKISFATRPGSVAADGEGDNGLYTEHLLRAMNEKGIPIEQALKNIYAGVKKASKGKQEPWSEGEIEGDFYFIFNGPTTINVQPAAQPAAPVRLHSAAEIEQELWDSIKDANTLDGLNEYLKAYPKGRYATHARVLIAKLKKESALPTPIKPELVAANRTDNAESALWNAVEKGNNADDYDAYLSQYPKGKYAALAKSRKAKLLDQAAQEAQQREAEAWAAAESGNSEESYAAYLKAYSSGQYAQLAKNRQKKLAEDKDTREEQESWKQAEASAGKSALQGHLSRYPAGRHADAARQKLAQIEKEEAEMKPGKVFRDCPDCPEMVVLPAGSFEMGENSSAHRVTLKGFAIGKSEVTQGQWRSVMGNNPSHFSGCGDNCPVEQVSWGDAQEYVRKLSARTGKTYRLPSEAEWEYACRAGGRQEYCGSDSVDSVAWHDGNSGSKSHAVSGKQANAWGLYDMSGNVWEWTEDCWNANYNGAPTDGSAWTTGGCSVGRMLRGGSWGFSPYVARSAFRGMIDSVLHTFGFRLARMLP